MAWSWPLSDGMVMQVTQSAVAMDQLVQNRFDIVIANVSIAVSSNALLTSIRAAWAANFAPILSDRYIHVQTKVQIVTDIIPGTSGPKRVYGLMDREGPATSNDGLDASNALPYDATLSAQLITTGAPGPFWGRKSFGPVSVDTTVSNGEEVEGVRKAAWQLALDTFFVPPVLIGVGTATWEAVVIPATAIAALPLPHAALNTLVKDVVATDVGIYVGSQATRRITPYALRGH